MAFDLGDVPVHVKPPVVPAFRVTSPPVEVSPALVVPVVGPQGPAGESASDIDAIEQRITSAVAAHATHTNPHAAYDDMPSLRLLFENRLI